MNARAGPTDESAAGAACGGASTDIGSPGEGARRSGSGVWRNRRAWQEARHHRGGRRASSCPSWARTRTLLIQSQTCCQLHQGADTPLRYASFPPGAGYATYPDIPSPATPPKHCKLWQHSPLRRTCSAPLVIPCAALLAPTAAGCRASIDAFGTSPAQARAAAENAFAAFAYRFYEVRREPSFNRARELMGQYALMPSRLYRDSTLWNVA